MQGEQRILNEQNSESTEPMRKVDAMDGLERTRCYVCQAEEGSLWAEENGYRAVKCRGCGLVYVNPRPALQSITTAHQTGQHRTDAEDLSITTRFSFNKVRDSGAMIRRMFPASVLNGEVAWLDVGAGNGELLYAVREVLGQGTRIEGIEPNRAKRQRAHEHGIELVDGSPSDLSGGFDVVSMINVFSHLPDPPSFLNQVRDQLRPRGSLLIVTGNGGDLESRSDYPGPLDLPDHLSFIGVQGLTRLMATLGFGVGQVVTTRVDTVKRCLNLALAAKPRRVGLRLPYTSPFRSITIRFERAD